MKFTIAQIGKNRLERVLVSNKESDPNKILSALEYDVRKLLENYMEAFDIKIEASQEDNIFNFDISVKAERIKSFGTLPS